MKGFSDNLVKKVVLFILLFVATSSYASNEIDGIRIWPAPENTRIVFDLKKKPAYSYFSLSNPQRLVIDFKDTTNVVVLEKLAAKARRINK